MSTLYWNKGDLLEIRARVSAPGKGLTYPSGTYVVSERGCSAGWDVYDTECGLSFYGFSVAKVHSKYVRRVIVGNIGTVYEGNSIIEASRTFDEYVRQSSEGIGRAAGESVIRMRDDDITAVHYGTVGGDDDNN